MSYLLPKFLVRVGSLYDAPRFVLAARAYRVSFLSAIRSIFRELSDSRSLTH